MRSHRTRMDRSEVAAQLWRSLEGAPASLASLGLGGPLEVLPSVYDVTGLATTSVAVALLAAAELWATRCGGPPQAVEVDSRHACAAFLGEALYEPRGWERPPAWDPLAGDYQALDGWIKVHTNYRHHREAALRVLQTEVDRVSVARSVATWRAHDLERAIVEGGGCAAAMRSGPQWAAHPQAQANQAPLSLTWTAGSPLTLPDEPTRPLAGVRVLDLTRVIAGPVCTRFLAAQGADVLRVDPPGFEEVPALLPETTVGKRCCFLDLTDPDDRTRFEALVAEAHIVVIGLRPGALDRIGLSPSDLHRINPEITVVGLATYGWSGPWAGRRGFDSLVQTSCGIAARGAEVTGAHGPVPLPAQALDHATGYLLAAATCRALTRALAEGVVSEVRGSLAGTANLLVGLGEVGRPGPTPALPDDAFEVAETAWGPLRRVRCPGPLGGLPARGDLAGGPLGRHPARFPD